MMKTYRKLTDIEIEQLVNQYCQSSDWSKVLVSEDFDASFVRGARFSGDIRLGAFKSEFTLAGGIRKHSGIYNATLHNVTVGDDCCIENVKNYIANYEIGDNVFIENVDSILVDGESSFGNGVEVAVLNETGGREVTIYDRLSAQQAYILALYRYKADAIVRMKQMIRDYAEAQKSTMGRIGEHSFIVDTGYIKNVRLGAYSSIEGAARLKNGSINSNASAPVHIGVGVIGDDFIVSSGSTINDCVMFSRCFIGQACRLGHGYSASDSLFFANCQGENGEACAIFAGPYTVTHHKSSLLIAGMFSFMNAGSGSNQSNHMYKLGPIHQGIMERGAKTASDSYILWPARIGAFSLVMGRHSNHQDTSNLPFSYLIERQNTTYIMPGANLKSVGTIRDVKKWPQRDKRTDPDKLDIINFNLLSPYTVTKMIKGIGILDKLVEVSGPGSEDFSYQNGKIRISSLNKGKYYYSLAVDKFLGNSLVTRIMQSDFSDLDSFRDAVLPTSEPGLGKWIDLAGLIVPKSEVTRLHDDVESGKVNDILEIGRRFQEMHSKYYDYEWTWAYDAIKSYYGIDLSMASPEDIMGIVNRWKESVVKLDNLLIEDARKEFSLSAMTSFGADGTKDERDADFEQVRGASFESDPFVQSIRRHIIEKTSLCSEALKKLEVIYSGMS